MPMKGLQICMEIMVLFYYCPREKKIIFKIKNYIFKIRPHLTGQPRAQPIQGWNCASLKKIGKKKPI